MIYKASVLEKMNDIGSIGINFGYGVYLDTVDKAVSARLDRNTKSIYTYSRQVGLIDPIMHDNWLNSLSGREDVKMYSIFLKDDEDSNDPVSKGVCGLSGISPVHKYAEFSIYLSPYYMGQKIGRKALRTLLDHAFLDQNLNRVWGETFDTNPALKIFTDIGFKKEGVQRKMYYKDGQYIDSHIIGILKDEWLKERQKEEANTEASYTNDTAEIGSAQ